VSTWHRAAAVTHSTTYFDGMSTIEGSADTAARTLRPKPTSSPYHKLTFLCRSGMRSQAAAADVAPQTRSCQVTGIRDEQGNTVTFASRNTAVLGGGIVHTVNAVSAGTPLVAEHIHCNNSPRLLWFSGCFCSSRYGTTALCYISPRCSHLLHNLSWLRA
jgi:hypothetical protein